MLVSQEADRPLTGLYGAGIDMSYKHWEGLGPNHPIPIMASALSAQIAWLKGLWFAPRWQIITLAIVYFSAGCIAGAGWL